MKLIHVVAGLAALAAGAVALCAAKGSPLHRKGGMVFVAAMLVMTSTAAVLAVFITPNRANVVAAVLTFYLVCTSLLTIRPPVANMRAITAAFMLVALATGLRGFDLGFEALESPRGVVDRVPAAPLFMFAMVGTLGAVLDARLLWVGRIVGVHRLARHLWRMTFAMWIATTSFFLGQADFLPEPVRKYTLQAIPVILVTIVLFYWLARVLIKRERALKQVRAIGS